MLTRTFCGFTPEGVPAVLPKTELIGLVDRQQEIIGMVPWHEVQQVAGDLLKAQGLYPERYRVEHFPGQDQPAALKSKAV